MLVGEFVTEDLLQNFFGIRGANYHIEFLRQQDRLGELAVPAIAVTETQRAFSVDVAQQNVGLAEDRQGVKEVQALGSGQVALPDVPRHAAVLTPLYVDRNLRPRPAGMQYRAMPVSPEICGGVSRVVAYP